MGSSKKLSVSKCPSEKETKMSKIHDVAVIVGSLRKDSINRKVAHALAEVAPDGLKLDIVVIGQLPIYNQDGDDNPPAEWTAFRERIQSAAAVLFVTPEHNRSVPAAPKDALDVGSRPYGKNARSGKPRVPSSARHRVLLAALAPITTCVVAGFPQCL
jgi:chromate reductase